MAVGATTSLVAAAKSAGRLSGTSEPSTLTAHSPAYGHGRNQCNRKAEKTARGENLQLSQLHLPEPVSQSIPSLSSGMPKTGLQHNLAAGLICLQGALSPMSSLLLSPKTHKLLSYITSNGRHWVAWPSTILPLQCSTRHV